MLTKKKLILLLLLFGGKNVLAQIHPFYSATTGKYGYKNDKGTLVIEPKYDLAYGPNEGMAAFRLHGKYGYIDTSGREIVPPVYDNTWKYIGGFSAVEQKGKFGFIDKTGKLVVPLIYDDANNFHGSCCYKGKGHVKLYGKWKIITINP